MEFAGGSPVNILIVDDSKSVHAFLRDLLRGCCVELVHAYNGAEGLARFRDGGFDLVLMDWEMPVMTGLQALKEMRDLRTVTPILMMTTRNSPADLQAALGLGVSEYMMKPFTRDILLAKIEQITGRELTHAA